MSDRCQNFPFDHSLDRRLHVGTDPSSVLVCCRLLAKVFSMATIW